MVCRKNIALSYQIYLFVFRFSWVVREPSRAQCTSNQCESVCKMTGRTTWTVRHSRLLQLLRAAGSIFLVWREVASCSRRGWKFHPPSSKTVLCFEKDA